MEWFRISAKNYKLSGKSLEDVCEHNAQIAQNLERTQVFNTLIHLIMLSIAAAFMSLSNGQLHSFDEASIASVGVPA